MRKDYDDLRSRYGSLRGKAKTAAQCQWRPTSQTFEEDLNDDQWEYIYAADPEVVELALQDLHTLQFFVNSFQSNDPAYEMLESKCNALEALLRGDTIKLDGALKQNPATEFEKVKAERDKLKAFAEYAMNDFDPRTDYYATDLADMAREALGIDPDEE